MTYYDDGLVKWIIDKNYYNCVCVLLSNTYYYLLDYLFVTHIAKEETTDDMLID
jgi:hypothetical protein